ncbi:hypothetical protein MHYP_G00188780 [Metynnis hypsauchen]
MVGGAGDEGGVGGETSRRVRLQSGSTDQLRRSSFDTELGKASLSWLTCRMGRPWRNIVGRKDEPNPSNSPSKIPIRTGILKGTPAIPSFHSYIP